MKIKEFLGGRIVVYNADCLEIMKKIGDKEIDLVLTDPPYGLGYDKTASRVSGLKSGNGLGRKGTYQKTDWDKLPNKNVFDEILRISKDQIIWGGEHLCLMLPKSRGWMVWDKNNGTTKFSDCELAWSSFSKPIRRFTYTWNGMLQQNMADKETRIHPTQKPTGLMNWCLLNNTKENDLIFDGFLGSGTTAISCIRTNRRLISCELDPIYFAKACDRINQELCQLTLF